MQDPVFDCLTWLCEGKERKRTASLTRRDGLLLSLLAGLFSSVSVFLLPSDIYTIHQNSSQVRRRHGRKKQPSFFRTKLSPRNHSRPRGDSRSNTSLPPPTSTPAPPSFSLCLFSPTCDTPSYSLPNRLVHFLQDGSPVRFDSSFSSCLFELS